MLILKLLCFSLKIAEVSLPRIDGHSDKSRSQLLLDSALFLNVMTKYSAGRKVMRRCLFLAKVPLQFCEWKSPLKPALYI